MKKILISAMMLITAITTMAQGWPERYGGVMLQGFWWDSYEETRWANLTARADELSQFFDLIWIPNAGTTASGKWNELNKPEWGYPNDMGYMPCYWLEYNTGFGTEQELRNMIAAYRQRGTGIIEDVVVNHKNGYGGWWWFPSEEKTGTQLGNMGMKYTITWDNAAPYRYICQNDEAQYNNDSGIAGQIHSNDDTGDNFDGCRDLNHCYTQVQDNIKTYQRYLLEEMGFAGFRLDMVKGYHPWYTGEYNYVTNPEFSVGEFWDGSVDAVKWWIDGTSKRSAAFDFPLKDNINSAFNNGNWNALTWKGLAADVNYQRYSVTFADNHDTGREDQGNYRLVNNWSAANAFILALPGTPCVWIKHYNADKQNIGNMILARKAAGIHNQSTIITQETTNDGRGYILETCGEKGAVYVQFGEAVNHGTPAGYTLVAQGDAYKFFKRDGNAPKLYDENEISVFYETDADGVKIWAWNDTHNFTGGVWDNRPDMTYWGKNNYGHKVFKWTYTGTQEGMPSKVIFQANGQDQTADLDFVNHAFYYNDNNGVNHWNVTEVAPKSNCTLLYNNTGLWSNVYCYAWNRMSGTPQAAWPGTKITDTDANGMYVAHVSYPEYDMVIFNNGASGEYQRQTPDCAIADWHIYNKDGATVGVNYTVADGTPYTSNNDIMANTATYSRTMSNQWGTLCLPFAIKSDENVQYYTLNEASNTTLSFKSIDRVEAGQPVLFQILSAANSEGKYELNISSNDVVVKSAAYGKDNAALDGWHLMGTYEPLTKKSEDGKYVYYIASGKFWNASKETNIPAYRAWIETTQALQGKSLTIFVDDTITEIEGLSAPTNHESDAVYNIQGQRVGSDYKGIVIINGKKQLKR